MTVAIDATILEDRRWTGVERYLAGIIQGFGGVSPPADILLISRAPIDFSFPLPDRVRAIVTGPSRLPTAAWRELVLPRVMKLLRARVLHAGVSAVPLLTFGYSRIATIHELTWRHAEDPVRNLAMHKFRVAAAARVADRIIVNSEHTRADVMAEHRRAADKIRIVYPGLDAGFTPGMQEDPALAEARARAGVPTGRYFIFVGRIEPKKNLIGMLDALAQPLPGRPSLLLIGRLMYEEAEFERMVADRGLGGRVVRAGFVTDADLIKLLRGAAALLYISEMEGFGFPPLEAMACGTPAIVSDRGAIPEVSGDAAIVVAPYDLAALVHAMRRILEEPELRRSLSTAGMARAARFTYEASARAAAQVYTELLDQVRR